MAWDPKALDKYKFEELSIKEDYNKIRNFLKSEAQNCAYLLQLESAMTRGGSIELQTQLGTVEKAGKFSSVRRIGADDNCQKRVLCTTHFFSKFIDVFPTADNSQEGKGKTAEWAHPMMDWGAPPSHGPYTHRIQWWMVEKAKQSLGLTHAPAYLFWKTSDPNYRYGPSGREPHPRHAKTVWDHVVDHVASDYPSGFANPEVLMQHIMASDKTPKLRTVMLESPKIQAHFKLEGPNPENLFRPVEAMQ